MKWKYINLNFNFVNIKELYHAMNQCNNQVKQKPRCCVTVNKREASKERSRTSKTTTSAIPYNKTAADARILLGLTFY